MVMESMLGKGRKILQIAKLKSFEYQSVFKFDIISFYTVFYFTFIWLYYISLHIFLKHIISIQKIISNSPKNCFTLIKHH